MKQPQWPSVSQLGDVTTYPAPGQELPDLQSFFIESVTWQGKPTRVFTIMGLPENASPSRPVPGIVLLHGGGGTAFAEWVRIWNRAGYAAITVDQCGRIPPGPDQEEGSPRERHPHGGPPGWGDSFTHTQDPIEDQWPYHAVAAAMRAHALLASLPEVNADAIGVTGASWGGYLTCLVAGVDDAFRFAIPIYGCGFLGHNSVWRDSNFSDVGEEAIARWLALWDPSQYLPRARMPFLWLNGTNDNAYPLDSWQLSYLSSPAERTIAVRAPMPHSHPDSWKAPESYVFADGLCMDGPGLPRLCEESQKGNELVARFENTAGVTGAQLICTMDTGIWKERQYTAVDAKFNSATGEARATVPAGAAVCYLNLLVGDCVVSTPHRTASPTAPLRLWP